MNEQDAIDRLNSHKDAKPSEVGEAVDVLYRSYDTYERVAQQLELKIPDYVLGRMHRIYRLPKGILWKVDEGQIGTTQAALITRLKDEESQWLLAITTVEKKLRANECENVVNLVLKEDWSIRDALSTVTGVRFEEISPPTLLLPVGVDFWFALIRASWGQSKDWQDLCYQLIREGVDVDIKKVADQLDSLANDVASNLESLAATLRQAGERYAEEVRE